MKRYFGIIFLPLLISCSGIDSNLICEHVESDKFVVSASWCNNSKVAIDNEFGKLVWNPSDSIALFTSSKQTPIKMVTLEGGETAQFASEISPEGPSPYIALSPYNVNASFSGNIVYTSIPEYQKPLKGSFDPLSFISFGKSDNTEIAFHNLCGGIRFTVSRDSVTKVVFYGNNNEALAGPVQIDLSQESLSLDAVEESSHCVFLASDDSLNVGSFYYLTFLPQTFKNGFTMEFYHNESLVSTSVCERPVTINPSVYSTIYNADIQESLSNILTGVDLSVDGTQIANCYVISSPGYYKFPVYKGLSSELIREGSSYNVFWESDNSSNKPALKSLISDIAYKGGYLYFKAQASPGDAGQLANGNALVVAFSENGKILWSWHIWLCDGYDVEATAQAISKSGLLIMDRNIGALSSEKDSKSYGLLFQWGRKDPFIGISVDDPNREMGLTSLMESIPTTTTHGIISYSISNPKTFITASSKYGDSDWMYQADNSLWGETKTDYDPCPYGWRVPSSDDFNGSLSTFQTNPNGVMLRSEDSGEGLWFPACGYRNKNSELVTSLSEAWYWTSSTGGTLSKAVYVDCVGKNVDFGRAIDRARACVVRCVKDVKE